MHTTQRLAAGDRVRQSVSAFPSSKRSRVHISATVQQQPPPLRWSAFRRNTHRSVYTAPRRCPRRKSRSCVVAKDLKKSTISFHYGVYFVASYKMATSSYLCTAGRRSHRVRTRSWGGVPFIVCVRLRGLYRCTWTVSENSSCARNIGKNSV